MPAPRPPPPAAAHPQAFAPSSTAAIHALCILVLLGVSLATFAYDRTLLPLYGSAATQAHLNKVVWAICIAGTMMPALDVWPSVVFAGGLLCAMPKTAFWVAALTGRMGDPVWGPVMTHLAVMGPVILLATSAVKKLQANENSGGIFGAPVQAVTLPVCQLAIMQLQPIWPLIAPLREMPETDLLVSLGCIAIGLWSISSFLPALPEGPAPPGPRVHKIAKGSGKSYWRIAVLPLLPYLLQHIEAPTIPKPMLEPYVSPPVRILSSVPSPFQGVVVVGEVLPPTEEQLETEDVKEPYSLRYLRAGHSLLGGVWIGDRVYRKDGKGAVSSDTFGTPLGDSIYSTFVTQEAARLVELSDGRKPKNALMIGLGTGIAASAFIQHDLSTTVLELDPAIYDAAKTYFGFKPREPENVHIGDARSWISRQTRPQESQLGGAAEQAAPKETFDIVVHDVFSGGGVPSHSFTLGFWESLQKVMSPDGVVAVNFAGVLLSDSGRAIVVTLLKAFPQCRAFYEYATNLTDDKLSTDFINWVFFCTPSTKDITFRPAIESDFLGSYLREQVLSSLPAHELDLSVVMRDLDESKIRKYTLEDATNHLDDWQDKEALHHWKLMREILPDVHWETY